MRLRQIEVFHAIYSSGSMTNAAALLCVSQPSVSKVLAHAEQQLGYRLFDRIKGKLVPTPEAHQLFSHVTAVYEDIDRLRRVATNLKAASAGRIRVACTPAFGLELLPQAVAEFRRQYDDTVFELETLHLDGINDALIQSRIDIALAFDPVVRPGVRQQQLATGRFVVLAHDSAEFSGKSCVSIRDIQDKPFVALNSHAPLGLSLSEYLASHSVKLNVIAWAETYHVAKALVACGAGVTIVDEITARSSIARDVVILPLEPPLRFNVKLLTLVDKPLSLNAKRFRKHLGTRVKQFLARIETD
jgi:DNA-binding transcriptional LysR family regulator